MRSQYKKNEEPRFAYRYHKGNYQAIHDNLSAVNWDFALNSNNIGPSMYIFLTNPKRPDEATYPNNNPPKRQTQDDLDDPGSDSETQKETTGMEQTRDHNDYIRATTKKN